MFEYKAEVLEVKDGDTVTLRIDLGFSMNGFELERGRLYGIDAPEKASISGKAVKAWLVEKLPIGSTVYVRTVKMKTGDERREKFGGYLVVLFDNQHFEGQPINEEMIALGLAKPYFGGAR